MKKRAQKILLIFLLSIGILSCKSNDPCEEIACTLELRTELVTIKDQNQNPLALDSFQVINTQTNENITISLSPDEFQAAQQNGIYPLIDDLGIEENQTLNLTFQGFKNGNEIVSENYIVTSDCCHIDAVSENLNLVVNQ